MPVDALPSAEECNCFAVRAAARHVTQFYDQCLAPTGLRTTQFSILAKLERKGSLTINALAEAMVMDRSTLSRNILPLERDGLIAIEMSAADRRARVLRLTSAGEKRLQPARKLWSLAQDRFELNFGRTRSTEMRALMRAVVASSFIPPNRSVER